MSRESPSHLPFSSFNSGDVSLCFHSLPHSFISNILLYITSAGVLPQLFLFLMSLNKSKSPRITNTSTPRATANVIPSEDEEALPEIDLISLDEPEPVADLGDFSAVWQYLTFQGR